MVHIVDIQVARLQKRLAERHIKLELDEKAKLWLADKGYDPVYGARPLKRVIQKELQDALANKMLAGEVTDGSTVTVKGWDAGLNITVKAGKTKAA
jgi:ATP-dependent Clp protease ATP-binding subunit ClpB